MRDDIDAKPSRARDGTSQRDDDVRDDDDDARWDEHRASVRDFAKRCAREFVDAIERARGPREGSPNARARGMGRRRVGSRRGGDDARRRATARAGGAGGTMGGRARGSGGARRSRARGIAAARARGIAARRGARGAFEGFRSCD